MDRSGPNAAGRETDTLLNKSASKTSYTRSNVHLVAAEARGPKQVGNGSSVVVTLLILITEMCERLTYYSIMAGMVLYCTSNLDIDQDNATTLNQLFSGLVYLIPVFGGFLADSYLGRYRTIYISCIFYLVGVLLVSASAVNYTDWGLTATTTTERRILFITGLALVGLGSGGIKANVAPFGAEQVESKGKEAVQSFFNWHYWVINLGALVSFTVVAYVQQEISFAWGFFIPAISTGVATLVFILGQSKYKKTAPKGSILATACGICGQGSCKSDPEPNPDLPDGSERKILARSKKSFGGRYDDHLVDGVTSVIKVMPFCLLAVMYWAVNAQKSTTFFAQAERMDVRLGGGMHIPAAALNGFNTVGIIILIPIVDKAIYPFFERIGHPLTFLKRIGIGMFLVAAAVVVGGVVEIYRKKALNAHIQVLAGQTFTASSMSVFLQIPQFLLIGTSEIFASVTVREFAYNQAPKAMQGLLTGLFLASAGIGSWIFTAILSVVEAATVNDPWWSSDINHAKMENLMFLLAGLMIVNLAVFCVVAHFYTYQDPSQFEAADTQHKDGEIKQPLMNPRWVLRQNSAGTATNKRQSGLYMPVENMDSETERVSRDEYEGDTESVAFLVGNDKSNLLASAY